MIPSKTDVIEEAFNEITVAQTLGGSFKNRSIVEIENPMAISTRINEDDDGSVLSQAKDDFKQSQKPLLDSFAFDSREEREESLDPFKAEAEKNKAK